MGLSILDYAGLIGIVLCMCAVAYSAIKSKRNRYHRAGSLLTAAEKNFFTVLRRSVGDDETVMCKVRIADVVNVDPGYKGKRFWKHFAPISSKHFDYVVCDIETMDVRYAVELDDSSHDRKERVMRDKFVNELCSTAGLCLVRVKNRRSYNAIKLKTELDSLRSRAITGAVTVNTQ